MGASRELSPKPLIAGSDAYGYRKTANTISVVLHATLVVALVYLTARQPLVATERDRERVAILDLEARPKPPAPPPPRSPATEPRPDKPRGFQTVTAPVEIPTTIPPPAEGPFDPADYSGRGVEGGVAGGLIDTAAAPAPSHYDLTEVTVMPRMIRVAEPEFPAALDHIRGRVILQAILLEDGKVDPSTIRVLKPLNPLLDEAARRALIESKFSPAQVRGKSVKVAIIVPYVFGGKGG